MDRKENDRKAYRRFKGPVLSPAKVEAIVRREGRTLGWISEKCFTTPESMRQILKGRRRVGAATFQLLIQALGCEAHELAATDEAEAS